MKIYADELRPGDVVANDGHTRRITDVDRRAGWAWPIAVDGSGWAIALDHRLIDVHRTRRAHPAGGVTGPLSGREARRASTKRWRGG